MHASSVRALSRPPPARRSRTEKAFAKATSEERCAPQDRFAFVARGRRPSSAPVFELDLTSRALSARLPHPRRKQAMHRAASAPAAQATRARSRYASSASPARLPPPRRAKAPFSDFRDCERASRTPRSSSPHRRWEQTTRLGFFFSFVASASRREPARRDARVTDRNPNRPLLFVARSTARRCERRRRAPRRRFEAAARRF